ncbi:hypothetical protein [uncultured Nostoc sp.]|uniref:hypothetical protein n=1 Tax=uncultured Nostoc sp. TaxID=340711 RepID=UPI0035CBA089
MNNLLLEIPNAIANSQIGNKYIQKTKFIRQRNNLVVNLTGYTDNLLKLPQIISTVPHTHNSVSHQGSFVIKD